MNETLRQLYQEIVLEHHAHPRHAGPLAAATHQARLDNPLCGDRVTLHLRLEGDRIAEAGFEGDGCAISIASASLLTTMIADRTIDEACGIDAELRRLLSRGAEHDEADRSRLGDLVALEGTRLFPSRIQCATLAWDALGRALSTA
jgi:nitrogen fixation protein NifU and related proteins